MYAREMLGKYLGLIVMYHGESTLAS